MKTKTVYLYVAAIFSVLFLAELAFVLHLNSGTFSYTLDDPYIHMALAKHIAHGHYGINATEYSAPSSSIIWPFLLAPFSGFRWFGYVPLLINFACGLGIIYLFFQLWNIILADSAFKHKNLLVVIATLWLAGVVDLLGLAFTGMEHLLQVYLSLLLAYGLIMLLRDQRVTWWLVAAIIAGPLVRYENLALSALAIICLAAQKQWRSALGSVLALGALAGGFSYYLSTLGLGYFPSSVLAKAALVTTSRLEVIMDTFISHLAPVPTCIILVSSLLFFQYHFYVNKTTDRYLALIVGAAILAHMMFGYPQWYFRYDAYIISVVIMGLIYLGRHALAEYVQTFAGLPAIPYVAVLLILCLPVVWTYMKGFDKTAVSANNIFEQQYQMHRFVQDYYRGPVAINDLGWVAYENPHYVLDLWGLASLEALQAKRTEANPAWMDKLARKHHVKLAIIYDSWFRRKPPSWKAVAVMELGKTRITPADRYVTFYALDEDSYREIRQKLLEFKDTLPAGVTLKVRK